MPRESASTPIAVISVSPARYPAQTTPTAIPSGMLWSVTASTIMVVRRSRLEGPSGCALPQCRWGMIWSSASRNRKPSQRPAAAGAKDHFPSSSDRSIAGISRLQTDAAVITPAAKPVSPFCRPSDIAFFIKNTLAAPREVPKNGSRSPYNASIIHPFSSCVRNQYPCVQNTDSRHRCQIHFPTGWPFTNPENRCRSGQQGASLLCLTQGTGCRMAPFPLISGSF